MSPLSKFHSVCVALARRAFPTRERAGKVKRVGPFFSPQAASGADGDLARALTAGSVDKARDALERGASVSASMGNGRRAIHLAAEAKRQDLCELLLSRGASFEQRSSFKYTALQHALEADGMSGAFIAYLLSRGASPNAESGEDFNPLGIAICRASVECVSALIAGGASLEGRAGKSSPLEVALITNNLPATQALAQAGADCSLALRKVAGGEGKRAREWLLCFHEQAELESAACAGRSKATRAL